MSSRGPVPIAVFASGGGTNLQALIDRFNDDPDACCRVALVVVSREDIGAFERATAAGIPVVVAPPEGILRSLGDIDIGLIVLAGYLKLIPPEVIQAYRNRILNIHPALLPGFGGKGMYGIRVHQAVLEAGVRVTGATVHLIDEEYDRGEILAQWPVPVLPGDTPESLAARVLRVEHLLLPAVVEAVVTGRAPEPARDPLCFELREGVPSPVILRAPTAAEGPRSLVASRGRSGGEPPSG